VVGLKSLSGVHGWFGVSLNSSEMFKAASAVKMTAPGIAEGVVS
jgi:hypothetical protein